MFGGCGSCLCAWRWSAVLASTSPTRPRDQRLLAASSFSDTLHSAVVAGFSRMPSRTRSLDLARALAMAPRTASRRALHHSARSGGGAGFFWSLAHHVPMAVSSPGRMQTDTPLSVSWSLTLHNTGGLCVGVRITPLCRASKRSCAGRSPVGLSYGASGSLVQSF